MSSSLNFSPKQKSKQNKKNIDTDTQWAYWDGIRQYEAKNRDYLQVSLVFAPKIERCLQHNSLYRRCNSCCCRHHSCCFKYSARDGLGLKTPRKNAWLYASDWLVNETGKRGRDGVKKVGEHCHQGSVTLAYHMSGS